MSRDKTATKRNATYRDRLRESGLVLVQVWAHPDDRERVRRYAERLRQRCNKTMVRAG